jgi:predicted enzyme related to lactoylglutathione lyase
MLSAVVTYQPKSRWRQLMKRCFWMALAAFLLAPAPSTAQPKEVTMIETQSFGLYVLVQDVERSVVFYEALFGKSPHIKTPALVGFDVSGGLFGIVDRGTYGPGTTPGNSVRPYIRVNDIEKAFAHADAVAAEGIEQPGIVTEGPFRFFRVADPDGNVLEFFSFVPAGQ